MKSQILSLAIDIDTNKKRSRARDRNSSAFAHIFNVFNNLQCLYFGLSLSCRQELSFIVPQRVISTNLLKLFVCLQTFDDCLYLLDGRFNQLHTFQANISFIFSSRLSKEDEVGLFSTW